MPLITLEELKAQALKHPHPDAPTPLKIGDRITYTNDNGVTYHDKEIIGFCEPTQPGNRSVYLNRDCYWFPENVSNLSPTKHED